MTTAIAKREADLLDTLTTPEWPRQALEVIKRTLCPRGIPDDDFYVFVKRCQQTGLNPLVGEAYCIPRNTKGPNGPVTVHTFTPSAEGMRARAGRFPDFVKVDGAAVFEKDTVALIDEGAGEVQHKFSAVAPRGRLIGAWGRVVKKGTTPVVVWLPVSSRSGNSPFWTADPGSMLCKCAMVAALRQAYPVAFAGVYAAEELPSESAAPSVAETVLSRAEGQAAPVAETPALPPSGPVVEFGTWKGRPISGLALDEAEAAIEFAVSELQKAKPNARWIPKMEANLAEVRRQRDVLAAMTGPLSANNGAEDAEWTPAEAPQSREPGSDDA